MADTLSIISEVSGSLRYRPDSHTNPNEWLDVDLSSLGTNEHVRLNENPSDYQLVVVNVDGRFMTSEYYNMSNNLLKTINYQEDYSEMEKQYALDRDQALLDNEVTINGKTIQTRPYDELNLRSAIKVLAPSGTMKFTLKNNTREIVTREELEYVLDTGIQQGANIWATYHSNMDSISAI